MHLLAFVVFGYLLVAAVNTALPRLVSANRGLRPKSLKQVLLRALFMDYSPLTCVHLRLTFLFFNLFLFLILNLLSGNVKTEKSIVSTEEIVDSVFKLFKTQKVLVSNPEGLNLKAVPPKGSFLERLSGKETVTLRNWRDMAGMKEKGFDQYLLFMEQRAVHYVVSLLSENVKQVGLVVFLKPTSYFERLAIYRMRRGLDERRKRFINSR